MKKHRFTALLFLVMTLFLSSPTLADDCNPTCPLNGTYNCQGDMLIQGTCVVSTGTTATCRAYYSITLKPGFHAQSGSTFTARIGDWDDNLPDAWEIQYFGHLNWTDNDDPDNDGLTNIEEYNLGTNPNNPDTDGDKMPDGWEVDNNLDPLSDDAGDDADGDNYSNYIEYRLGSDPNNPNSKPPKGVFYKYDSLGRIKEIIDTTGN